MKVFRSGKVHILAERCPTCIFRPGNLMNLNRGKVKQLVDINIQRGAAIPCHDTIGLRGKGAICRGFFDLYKEAVPALNAAERMGYVQFDAHPDSNKQGANDEQSNQRSRYHSTQDGR